MADAVKYTKRRDGLSISEAEVNEELYELTVSDGLDNHLRCSCNLKRELPISWNAAKVSNNNSILPSRIEVSSGKRFVVFDAVSDNVAVQLAKSEGIGEGVEELGLSSPNFSMKALN